MKLLKSGEEHKAYLILYKILYQKLEEAIQKAWKEGLTK